MLGSALEELARREAEYRAWRIEQAAEAALQGGQHGVLVREWPGRRLFDARVHPDVPYGEIHHQRLEAS
jgi:hypothetical protein